MIPTMYGCQFVGALNVQRVLGYGELLTARRSSSWDELLAGGTDPVAATAGGRQLPFRMATGIAAGALVLVLATAVLRKRHN